jgi:hypothetical protein
VARGEHLVVPSLGDARLLVPLGPRAAARSTLEIYRPGRWLARAARDGLDLMARAGLLALAPAPRLRVWAAPGARLEPSPLDRVLDGWLGPGARLWGAWTGTPGPHRKISVRVLSCSGTPRAHVKAARDAMGLARLRAEHDALTRLAGLGLATARAPAVLGLADIDGWRVLALEHVCGARAPVPLEAIVALHEELHGRTAVRMALAEGDFWRALAARRADAGADDDEPGWRRCRERLASRALPLGMGHGDLAPWNVLAAAPPVVLDWETAGAGFPPLYDVLHWVVYAPLVTGRARPRDALAAVRSGAPAAALAGALARLGVEGVRLEELVLVYLVDRLSRLAEEQRHLFAANRARQMERLAEMAARLTAELGE